MQGFVDGSPHFALLFIERKNCYLVGLIILNPILLRPELEPCGPLGRDDLNNIGERLRPSPATLGYRHKPKAASLAKGVLRRGARDAGEGGDLVQGHVAPARALNRAPDDGQDGGFPLSERGGDPARNCSGCGLASAALKAGLSVG